MYPFESVGVAGENKMHFIFDDAEQVCANRLHVAPFAVVAYCCVKRMVQA